MKIKKETYRKHTKKESKKFYDAINVISNILKKYGIKEDRPDEKRLWKAIEDCVSVNTDGWEYCLKNEIDPKVYFLELTNMQGE